jgi:hypothetical protein
MVAETIDWHSQFFTADRHEVPRSRHAVADIVIATALRRQIRVTEPGRASGEPAVAGCNAAQQFAPCYINHDCSIGTGSSLKGVKDGAFFRQGPGGTVQIADSRNFLANTYVARISRTSPCPIG